MRFDGNGGSAVNYEPNSFGADAGTFVRRTAACRQRNRRPHDHRTDSDYYTQPGNLFRLMPTDAKQRLIDNIVSSLGNGVPQRIQELQIRHFYKADPAYGQRGEGLGLNIESMSRRSRPTRRIESSFSSKL